LSNAWVHWAVGLGVTLQLLTVLVPPLRTMLGLVSLSAHVLLAVSIAIVVTWAVAVLVSHYNGKAKPFA
jgi:Ca2+-transporting ATPase